MRAKQIKSADYTLVSNNMEKIEQNLGFVDMLEERRKDCDFFWATRPMNPLLPHMLPAESVYNRDEIIRSVLLDAQVRAAIDTIAKKTGVEVKDIENNARAMINEMASKADLATVRWLGIVLTLHNNVIF